MGNQVEIVRARLRIRSDPARPWIWLDLPSFSQPLQMEISVDALGEFDRSVSVGWDGVQQQDDRDRLTWTAKSTLWTKRYHLDVHAGHVEFHAEVQGSGDVEAIRFFDAIPDADFRGHFALTKHFNDKGETVAREYATGSPAVFRRVFCPEPNSYARQYFRSYEKAQISVNADLDYCGGNFAANPGPLCFCVAAEPEREWVAFGLAVEPGEHLFSEYAYLGGEDFALTLNSWGARRVEGGFRTPRLIMVPGATAEQALARYVEVLRRSGLAPRVSRQQPSWWSRPIVCGWGHQCYQADLFRIRSTSERPPDNAVYTLSTQANYRDFVERLDAHDLPWGTLIIDARWFLAGGLKNVDEGRWPDLRGFIDAQHRRGKRVLLWWGPWDPEGVPAEQCVRYLPGERPSRQNRPGRLAKFGTPIPGKKLAVDITLPAVRERIREQVRRLLGSGPDGYNADGFKIDHLSAVPGIYDMAFPDGSRRLFGIEAAHEYLALLYETAKDVRSDAVLIGQSPNPYLADVQDVLRLGDIYTHHPDSVVPEMTFRAAMARIADPDWLIDTDGWPMPSLAAFREYVGVQPTLGVPSLYYATHLDTTGEAFTGEDYARIRRAWSTS
ncbi:MAG: TIM-barrel domain-containing protein [Streptomycetales bacterium]